MTKKKVLICPYCGEAQPAAERCRACRGLFDALSRQATHNAMGPWFTRDRPCHPGCSYETLVRLIERGQVSRTTVVRGPTTKQFWTVARRAPGIAHLLGYCHQCDAQVSPDDHGCHACGAVFGAYLDRDYLGLPDVRPLPWEADLDDDRPPSARRLELSRSAAEGQISSFATDEELLHTAGAAAVADRPALEDGVGGRVSSADPVGVMAIGDETLSQATVRALQRRLAVQQRRVRTLAILLGAGVVIIAALAVPRLLIPSPDQGPGGTGTPLGPSTDRGESGTRTDVAAPALERPAEPPAGTAASSDDEAGSAAAGSNGPAPSARAVWEKRLEEAEVLAESGADQSREYAERVESYAKALELLETISSQAPAEARPEDLDEHRERIARALERLRLQVFFPDS